MSKITKADKGSEVVRKDGSQISADHGPTGETATENMRRVGRSQSNGGVNPRCEDDDKPIGRKDPARSVSDAFGIDDKNLLHSRSEADELTQAVSSLD